MTSGFVRTTASKTAARSRHSPTTGLRVCRGVIMTRSAAAGSESGLRRLLLLPTSRGRSVPPFYWNPFELVTTLSATRADSPQAIANELRT
jgi:hypothetical protein